MPRVFQAGNDELVMLRETRSLQCLEAYFRARTREWPYPVKEMECFTVGVFFDLGSEFRNDDAYDLITLAAQFPWDDLPDYGFLLGIDLLLELATVSHRTEVPRILAEKWDAIASRVMVLDPTYPAWSKLVRHYRRQT